MLGHGEHPFSRRQIGFRCPDQRRRTRRHSPDAGLHALRIQRRRQSLETELASEKILETCECGIRNAEWTKKRRRSLRQSFRDPHSAIGNSPGRAHVDRRRAHMAIERACSIKCTAMQIFVKNNMQWFARPLEREEIALFSITRSAASSLGFRARELPDQSRGDQSAVSRELVARACPKN